MKKLFLSSSFKDVANLFQDFVQEDVKGKTVTFIPTASLPEKIKFYVGSAKKSFEKLGIIVDELELTKSTNAEIVDKLTQNDLLYISGGNTFFLLQELRRKGVDKIIIEQIESGKIYIGESAGSMIVSPNIEYAKGLDDCKVATELDTFSALNVVDFYPLPHYGNFPFKKSVEKIISKYESELTLYPISNSQAILIKGTELKIETK
jgi:dipeptidase E